MPVAGAQAAGRLSSTGARARLRGRMLWLCVLVRNQLTCCNPVRSACHGTHASHDDAEKDGCRYGALVCDAGAAHSACLDQSGAVLAWRSADPRLHVQEVGGAMAGKRIVHIAAGATSATPSSQTAHASAAVLRVLFTFQLCGAYGFQQIM